MSKPILQNPQNISNFQNPQNQNSVLNSDPNSTTNSNSNSPKVHFHFISCGVSGGESGALNGPSIMPSGKAEIVEQILPILKQIAAKDFNGNPCVTNIGKSASGHFVKMVHNGIEYALMQGIAEIYDILRYNSYTSEEMVSFFSSFKNSPDLGGFLLEITQKILQTKDELSGELKSELKNKNDKNIENTKNSDYLLDKINQKAESKGTGIWTVQTALEFGIAVPTIAEALFVRSLSQNRPKISPKMRIDRQNANSELYQRFGSSDKQFLEMCLESVYVASFIQGIHLIQEANERFDWQIDVLEVLRIWQGGCIIRTKMLEKVAKIFDPSGKITGNFGIPFLAHTNFGNLTTYIGSPVIWSAINYMFAFWSNDLPTNLIQAQRDFFGAHTYKRTDKLGTFTGGWNE